MQQLQLPIITNTLHDPSNHIGLTTWVLASRMKPPVIGWWRCRRLSIPERLPARRWWDGHWFSLPVYLTDTDDEVLQQKLEVMRVPMEDLEWCGLKQPHPERYPYRLFTFGEQLPKR